MMKKTLFGLTLLFSSSAWAQSSTMVLTVQEEISAISFDGKKAIIPISTGESFMGEPIRATVPKCSLVTNSVTLEKGTKLLLNLDLMKSKTLETHYDHGLSRKYVEQTKLLIELVESLGGKSEWTTTDIEKDFYMTIMRKLVDQIHTDGLYGAIPETIKINLDTYTFPVLNGSTREVDTLVCETMSRLEAKEVLKRIDINQLVKINQ